MSDCPRHPFDLTVPFSHTPTSAGAGSNDILLLLRNTSPAGMDAVLTDEEERVTPFLHVIYMYDQESPVGRLCRRRCQTAYGQKNAASSSKHWPSSRTYVFHLTSTKPTRRDCDDRGVKGFVCTRCRSIISCSSNVSFILLFQMKDGGCHAVP
jgi:hypothetical protein